MKKLYKNPLTVVREMETEDMIAASVTPLDITDENPTATLQAVDAETNALSRVSIWEDEE